MAEKVTKSILKHKNTNEEEYVILLKKAGYSTYVNPDFHSDLIKNIFKKYILKDMPNEITFQAVDKTIGKFTVNGEEYENPILYEFTIKIVSFSIISDYTLLVFLDNNYVFRYLDTENEVNIIRSHDKYTYYTYIYTYILETFAGNTPELTDNYFKLL